MGTLSVAFSLFISGLLFGSGPCLANCGPILVSYVAGTGKDVRKALAAYALFSAARVCAYVILACIVLFLGQVVLEQLLVEYAKYLLIAGGIFIVLVGLLMAIGKSPEFKFLRFCHRDILERDKKSLLALGFIIGFLPCGPLLALLSYIALVARTWSDGLAYSLFFGLGTFVSPLIGLAMLAGLIRRFAIDKTVYVRVFNALCGAVLVFLGVQLLRRAWM